MSRAAVRAVVLPGGGDSTLRALERQTHALAEVGVMRRSGRAGGTPWPGRLTEPNGTWVWLLGAGVVPRPDALERLLEAADAMEALRSPALLASKVVDPGGSPDALARPIPAVTDPELTLSAFEHHLLALRAARRGSILVRRSALDRPGLWRGTLMPAGEDMLWTARLLREHAGFLVPASVAVRGPASPPEERRRSRLALAEWLRVVVGDALDPPEKPWFAFRLAEEALAAARGDR